MADDAIENLGPLAALAGTWEGDKGDDVAPSDSRGTANSKFRERITFEPTGRVDNHEQVLYGLRYRTTAWRIGADAPFHEESGYWMWDAKNKQVLRCFVIPRGIALIAGGTAEANAKSFTLKAEVGSETYGICSNHFLDAEFKTVRYELTVTIQDRDNFSYAENTVLKMKDRAELFDHRDSNTLQRVD